MTDTPRIDYSELQRLLKERTIPHSHGFAVNSDECSLCMREALALRGLEKLAPQMARELLDRQRWIPVSTPPNNSRWVLGWLRDANPDDIDPPFEPAFWTGARWEGETCSALHITHWREIETPRPEAPDAPHSQKEGK